LCFDIIRFGTYIKTGNLHFFNKIVRFGLNYFSLNAILSAAGMNFTKLTGGWLIF